MVVRTTTQFHCGSPLYFGGFIVAFSALVLVAGCASQPAPVMPAGIPYTVSGVVADPNGPVAGAIVQIQGTSNQVTTAKDGAYTIHGQGLGGTKVVTMTAWSAGHFIGWVNLDPQKPIWKSGGTDVNVKLKPLYTVDNNAYTWFTFEGVSGSASCGLCHREYKEWQADAHSQSATNTRFINVYRGTNVAGQKGPLTQLGSNGVPQPPDPKAPNVGPGFLLDYPDRAGNCATCHTPLASNTPIQQNCAWAGCHTSMTAEHAANSNLPQDLHGIMPVGLQGIGAEGITCEFCHKAGNVSLDPHTHLPLPDMPGILSMQLSRPPDGEQLFYGTMTDVSRRVSYSALETESAFCAPCHYGVFGGVMGAGTVSGGTVIYNSYGEWLNSSYSDPNTGKTCQQCHMPVLNTTVSVFPDKGGIPRDYTPFHDHTMTGVNDQALMHDALTLKSSAIHNGASLQLQVSVVNDGAGHDVPTDAPMRSVMLIVDARDAGGKPLALNVGPTLPAWTGNYAAQPGKAFAKVLKDNWSGETPTAAYWRPVTVVEDTRIAPLATDTTDYSFDLPAGSTATVNLKLVYRRSFQQLAEQKGWNDPDTTMAQTQITVEK